MTRIACYGCGGPHRMRHCPHTSGNMRARIWALLRRRDEAQPGAGIGGDNLDHDEDLPGLAPDPARTEQKRETPALGREGEKPPAWMAVRANEPPDKDFVEEAAATVRPPEEGNARGPGGSSGQDTQSYEEAAAADRPNLDTLPARVSCTRCYAPHQTSVCPVPWARPHPRALEEQRVSGCNACGGDHDIRMCNVVEYCLTNEEWAQRYSRHICYGCGGPHHLQRCRHLSPDTKDRVWIQISRQCRLRRKGWRKYLQRGAAAGGNRFHTSA